ncbi:F0F1 ATP synthase subunit A [Candidatus Roizmanbacteria bacterium]|nr:F0F1 ATP synthase subunit A [Candidatus Roizmanbacteria bacterium]
MPKISIKAEPIFHIFGFVVTNSLLSSIIVFLLTILIALYYYNESKQVNKGNLYYLIKFFVKSIYSLFASVFGDKAPIFFPILFAFFFYILLQNWFGLLPGVGTVLINGVPLLRGNDADLNTTLGLALISFFLIQYYSIKYLGAKGYLKKFFNFTNPIMFFVGILDIVSEVSKIISFSFRLFGNIFAGEVLMTIIAFLIPILASFPFLLFEIFVGLIQALVFSMLTAVFINGAIQEHH